MSKIDEYCEIRLAVWDDIEDIMSFIKTEWNENHILANDREFFEYEYCYNDRVNAEIAIDRETGKIIAFQGFICYGDTSIHEKVFIAGALMKATGKIPFTGVETQKHLLREDFVKNFIGNGLNVNTSYVLAKKVFKRNTGKMEHYYILSDTKDYLIADIKKLPDTSISNVPQYDLVWLKDSKDAFEQLTRKLSDLETNPYEKDEWYLTRRYFCHPIYHYKTYGIMVDHAVIGLLIAREQMQFGRKILRIIDFLSDKEDMSHLGMAFKDLIVQEEYEYIDMYQYGIGQSEMYSAGFAKVAEDDLNIIPNYFEPFEKKNIDVYWESPIATPVMFKGDGDQDRPSRR